MGNNNLHLRDFLKNVASQDGEDGIIERIFEIIPDGIQDHWCVEFGAWDGKYLSNTWNLIENKNWNGVMVEASDKKFEILKDRYKENKKVHCIKRYISFSGKDSLENVLAEAPIPADFDLISIDIDGNDYHVWDSLKKYAPKVVVIEFCMFISNHIRFVQPADMSVHQGSSLLSIVDLAKSKGYELICTTRQNGFFVKRELFHHFGITDNSLDELNPECKNVSPELFQLFDGTIVLTKPIHFSRQIQVSKHTIQVYPKYLRFDEENSSDTLRVFLRKIHARLWRFCDWIKRFFYLALSVFIIEWLVCFDIYNRSKSLYDTLIKSSG